MRFASRRPLIPHSHIDLHRLSRLHILLCPSAVAKRQTPSSTPKLPTTRRPIDKIAPQRVLGHHTPKSPRSPQIQKAPALERQKRCPIRSHQPNHPHRQRAEPSRQSMQPTRPIPLPQGHQSTLFGARVHVLARHVGVLPRRRQKTPRNGHKRFENRA